MFILTVYGKESEGAYSVLDDNGEQIIYLFEESDDAIRFAMMLEEEGGVDMHVIELPDESVIKSCEISNCKYAIITKNDFVIPRTKNDFI